MSQARFDSTLWGPGPGAGAGGSSLDASLDAGFDGAWQEVGGEKGSKADFDTQLATLATNPASTAGSVHGELVLMRSRASQREPQSCGCGALGMA